MTSVARAERRELLTSLYKAAVRGAAPFGRTRDAVLNYLRLHPEAETAAVHLFALGKASPAMAAGAAAALDTAGRTPAGGVVVCTQELTESPARDDDGHAVALPKGLTVVRGDHPVPGPGSLDAADAIDDAVQMVDEGDIAIVLLSGGTTALTAAPVALLSQAYGDAARAQSQVANLAELLLESGLAIHEMNAIRKRVLRWGAGRLAVALSKRGAAAIPVFAISDVIGDDPAVIGSGPCSADTGDDTDFLTHLAAGGVRGTLDASMESFLGLNGASTAPAVPPATHKAFQLVDYSVIAGNRDAVRELAAAARTEGISRIVIDSEPLEGSAMELGHHIAAEAIRATASVAPDQRALFVMGGEPTVDLKSMYRVAWEDDDQHAETGIGDPDEPMAGGRMQVLALAGALALERAHEEHGDAVNRITILAAGTDGRDGPTDAAGAIVDVTVPDRVRRRGRSPERDIDTGRSWLALNAANALLRTGPTGTNVMDVVAVLIDSTHQPS